jgi:hypothetical protein
MNELERLREALSRIAEVASGAVKGNGYQDNSYQGGDEEAAAPSPEEIGCSIKTLPTDMLVDAAKAAVEINPANAPTFGPVIAVAGASDIIASPGFNSIVVGKYWGPQPRQLSVSFMESTPSDLRARIVSHLNAWNRTTGIVFRETQGVGEVRISRGPGGYWSYLGTDITRIPQSRQTMNLQGFTMSTRDSEFVRVVRHEAGHTLGFPHEHMRSELVARIDPEKAYDYFRRTQGWDRTMVNQQVLTPLDDRTIIGTPPDQTSIMCYQLPGSITRDGNPILGGVDINQTDFDFAARMYPKPQSVVPSPKVPGFPPSPKWPAPPFQMQGHEETHAQASVWDFEYTA